MYLVVPKKTYYSEQDIDLFGINAQIFLTLNAAVSSIGMENKISHTILDLDKLEWINYTVDINTTPDKDFKFSIETFNVEMED